MVNNLKGTNSADLQLSAFFPKFVWLLRDFSLDLRMDNNTITPKEYLERILKPLDVGNL